MVVWTPAERPAVFPIGLANRKVVEARDAPAHEAVLCEFPVLVAVGAEPAARVVVPLVGEAHGDARPIPRPDFLDQPVVELPCPLAPQELHDRLAAGEELAAVSPDAVRGVRERNALGIAAVPRVLGGARLLLGGLARERWKMAGDVRWSSPIDHVVDAKFQHRDTGVPALRDFSPE